MPLRTDWFFATLAAIALVTTTAALATPMWGPLFEQPAVHAVLRDVLTHFVHGA